MNQEQLRNLIRDIHHVSHQLAEIRAGVYPEDAKRIESARDDLTAIRNQLTNCLDGRDGN